MIDSRLDTRLENFMVDYKAWLDSMYAVVVPVWCEGVQSEWWFTPLGQRFAELYWLASEGQRCGLKEAAQFLWPHRVYTSYVAMSVRAHVPTYARPLRLKRKTKDDLGRLRYYVFWSDLRNYKQKLDKAQGID